MHLGKCSSSASGDAGRSEDQWAAAFGAMPPGKRSPRAALEEGSCWAERATRGVGVEGKGEPGELAQSLPGHGVR